MRGFGLVAKDLTSFDVSFEENTTARLLEQTWMLMPLRGTFRQSQIKTPHDILRRVYFCLCVKASWSSIAGGHERHRGHLAFKSTPSRQRKGQFACSFLSLFLTVFTDSAVSYPVVCQSRHVPSALLV